MAEDSILDSTKKALGLTSDYTEFDPEIIMHINSVFATLQQLGVGPVTGFLIEDKETAWSAFIGAEENIASVRSYMYLKVRLLFDPPATSFAITAMENQAKEFEWRLNVVMEGVRHPWADPTLISPEY